MIHTAQVNNETSQNRPILIVDRQGRLGEALANELKSQALIVYCSRFAPQAAENIVYVPFDKQVPTIPDNNYSHIFLIDEEFEITKDVIKEFLKKAEQDKAFLVVAINEGFVKNSFPLDFISSYDKIKLVILGEIFKKNSSYNQESVIGNYINSIKKNGRIDVPGDGTALIAPVLFEDAVFGILETVFGTEENKLFYLFPKHRITLLSLAHIFQKQNPDIKIDFIKENKSLGNEFKPLIEGKYLLGDNYDFENKIKQIDISNFKAEIVQKKESKPLQKKEVKLKIKLLVLSLVLLLILPLLSTGTFMLSGAGALQITKSLIEKGDISSSQTAAFLAMKSFEVADLSVQLLGDETHLIGLDNALIFLSKNVTFGKNISEALVSTIDAFSKMKNILSGTSINPVQDFSNASIEIKNALYTYSMEKQAKIIPISLSKQLDGLTGLVTATVDFWSDALGFQGTRNYLILFQNNMELRPGGGFIGSYALLTFNKGKVSNFKIYDIYDADGQLKGHIEPPYPIRRYLPSVHWFMRDSNFNVDFSKGAVASAVFLNTEMHQPVDGVIGVDLSLVKNLLTVVGPIKVPDYNKTVSADNFYQITQAQTEDNFFPGSTQKKDFLTSFYNALQSKLSAQKNLSYLALAQVFIKSMNEKHILFAFNNVGEQAAFAINGWSSTLLPDAISPFVIDDFIGINEANLGGNKANYSVTRSISQVVNVKSDGSINENLTVSYKNSAPSSLGTKGAYKNYVRFILPLNATISAILINQQQQKIITAITDPTIYEKKDFIPPAGLEVQKEEQGGKTIYGLLVSVNPQSLETIQVNYILAQKINVSQSQLSYQLKFFKQPGIDSVPYDLVVNFPNNLKIVSADNDIKTNGQSAGLSTQISEDREVQINLAAK